MTQLTITGRTDLRDMISSLYDADTEPWASISFPVERAWNQSESNRVLLKTMFDRLREEGAEREIPARTMDAMLEPATDLPRLASFWEGDLAGVALFLAPDDHVALRLPFAPSVFSTVDDRVHVRSLWRHLEPDGTAYVLGLSSGGSALFRVSRYHIEEVPLENGPTTLDETLKYDEHERTVGYHSKTPPGSGKGGKRSAIFHGHEDAGDKRYVKEGVLRFFRALDNQVRDVVGQDSSQVPLLLAGVEELRGLYRQVNKYAHLLDEDVETSVIDPTTKEWDADELHRKAWEILSSHFDDDRRQAIDRFHSDPERTGGNPGSVLLAALEGRVDTLFVAEELMVWGGFDEEKHTVEIHPDRQPASTELLNAAALRTLQTGGTLYVSDAADVPEGGPIAAVLRY